MSPSIHQNVYETLTANGIFIDKSSTFAFIKINSLYNAFFYSFSYGNTNLRSCDARRVCLYFHSNFNNK